MTLSVFKSVHCSNYVVVDVVVAVVMQLGTGAM